MKKIISILLFSTIVCLMPSDILVNADTQYTPQLRGPVIQNVIIRAHCSVGGGGWAYVTYGDFEIKNPPATISYQDGGFVDPDFPPAGYYVNTIYTDSKGYIHTPYTEGYTYAFTREESVPEVCSFY